MGQEVLVVGSWQWKACGPLGWVVCVPRAWLIEA